MAKQQFDPQRCRPNPITKKTTMTKQHFEFVASLIDAANKGVAPAHLAIMAAAKFAKDNPRFDKGRFYNACGLCSDGTPKVKTMYGLENHAL